MSKLKLLLTNIILTGWIPGNIRNYILTFFGHKVTSLYPYCRFGSGSGHLYMEANSFCNQGCFFDLGSDIFIGANVAIGCNVHFLTTTHLMGKSVRRAAVPKTLAIHVGNGSWIGADTIILPGVKIGNGVVIGAGSLVTKDLADNCLYMGRPARLVKKLYD